MTTESPTGISAEFQNHLRSECERKLNETIHVNSSECCTRFKRNKILFIIKTNSILNYELLAPRKKEKKNGI